MSTTGSFVVRHLKLTCRSLMLIRKLLGGGINWANAQWKKWQNQWKPNILIISNQRPYKLFHWKIYSQCVHLNVFCCRIVLFEHSALFLRIICSFVLKIASLSFGNSCSCNNCWTDVNSVLSAVCNLNLRPISILRSPLILILQNFQISIPSTL